MSVLLLEGCDGAGKTTLARRLGGEYVHHGPLVDPWTTYVRCLVRAQRRPGLTVVDRAWPSEQIYGRRCRDDRVLLTPVEVRMLERLALAAGTLLVLCHPSWATVRDAWAARPSQELVTSEVTLRAIFDDYRDLRSELPVLVYNRDHHRAVGVVKLPRLPAAPRGWTGRWAPGETTLLVGERPNGPDVPFVGRTGCAPWLTQLLLEARVSERTLTWVNSHDARGRPLDIRLVGQLRPRRLIALGKTAAAYLHNHLSTRDRFTAVDHPQHWKRFHHHEDYPLIKELAR